MAGMAAAIAKDAALIQTQFGTIIMPYKIQEAAHQQLLAQVLIVLIVIHKTFAQTDAREMFLCLSRQ